jgi:Ca2+:H+ antiporter
MSGYTLSEGAREVLAGARREAERLGAGAIGAEHLLLSLLAAEPSAVAILERIGLQPGVVTERLAAAGSRRGRPAAPAENIGEDFPLTSHARRLLEVASRFARSSGGTLLPAHLLLAGMSEPRGALARLLGESGVDAAGAAAELAASLGVTPEPAAETRTSPGTPRPERRGAPRPEPDPAVRPPAPAPRGEPGPRQRRPKPEPRAEPEVSAVAPRPVQPAGEEPLEPRRPLPHLERAAARRRAGVSWKYLLLLAVPISIALSFLHASPVLVFVAACAAILPLAGLMGEATEQLAQKTGPTLGGLLNATFGNAAELIIALVALRAGQVELVKASITGSILGNLLLILGLSLMAASMHKPEVRFNRTAAGMSSAMMALAVIGLVFPAVFHATHPEAGLRTELWMSEAVAGILVVTYAASLFFSLKTHKRVFGGEPHPLEGPVWSTGRAVLTLGLATAFVAWESEILVHAIEPMTEILGLSPMFLGLIVIPIVGNAAEHAAAVLVARKGQTDLALQIALGSSTQVALLIAPILVAAGVIFGRDAMNLVFTPFEVMALGVSTVIISIITLDGESHWFEGVQLLAVYAMIAVGAFFI